MMENPDLGRRRVQFSEKTILVMNESSMLTGRCRILLNLRHSAALFFAPRPLTHFDGGLNRTLKKPIRQRFFPLSAGKFARPVRDLTPTKPQSTCQLFMGLPHGPEEHTSQRDMDKHVSKADLQGQRKTMPWFLPKSRAFCAGECLGDYPCDL